MSTFTTQQMVDSLVQVLQKSAGLEGLNVVDVVATDATHVTMKIYVPGGHPNTGDSEANPQTDRYSTRTVVLTVAVS